MDIHTATEVAYKNGYEQGLKDAVKHGYWTLHRFAPNYECSKCNFRSNRDSNYCPECGTAMDGICDTWNSRPMSKEELVFWTWFENYMERNI